MNAPCAALSMRFQFDRQIYFMTPPGAPVGRLREIKEWTRRFASGDVPACLKHTGEQGELTPFLPVISTKPSISFHASIFLGTKFHPKPLKASVTGDSQQSRSYFSYSISIEFVRVAAIQKKPTGASWLNTNCSGAPTH